MHIVIPLFAGFEPLDAIGPCEILGYLPGATVRFVAPEAGRVQDGLGALPVEVATRYSEVESCDVLLIPGGPAQALTDPDFVASYDSGSVAKATPEVLARARTLG
ncbi:MULTISPECIES: hypothetical protein [unclassified Kitasatospora]|uniref:hypothetical protein n=1 Tax=unclassified Kitasatospora TaxID=2633591 RepID=UPI00070D40A7|nr:MULTISPECIES: hypothetical protein [unclassified Kitasatospora]KQV22256.1 hypothetical protein ASC99_18115 [Kitasatospora sp. Root107]KRB64653.1 hypothetical protein ASE03_33160 [Kitasatospora sp. Root187]